MHSQINCQNPQSLDNNPFPFSINRLQPLLILPSQPPKGFSPYLDTPYPIKLYKIEENASVKALSIETSSSILPKQQAGSPSKKGSVYHNFQKHLVTTLKINIHLTYDKKAISTPQKRAAQLWQYFLKSKKPTKKFLYSLLKSAPIKIIDQENKLKKNYDRFQFQNSTDNLNAEDLEEAQTYLRQQIVKQSKKLISSGLLLGRRMQKMQQFQDYFCTFIKDVESDDFTLRLSKKKVKPQSTQKLNELRDLDK